MVYIKCNLIFLLIKNNIRGVASEMNEKMTNCIMAVIGICGCISHYFGGWDLLLQTILLLVITDFVTGWIKAISIKSISSKIGFQGLLKKIMIFIVISVANSIQGILKDAIPLRETIIMFYSANEALSIVENLSYFIPVPETLKRVLNRMKDNRRESEEDDSDDR